MRAKYARCISPELPKLSTRVVWAAGPYMRDPSVITNNSQLGGWQCYQGQVARPSKHEGSKSMPDSTGDVVVEVCRPLRLV
ncbi:uncharacterized protein LY89DRAFT_683151 [Mollisia scopiformis]|uniref:Uncharacterized protein n=1 Tax=Mollisia scopiformis TaxID=149040 RepID=A0A194XGA4_MOLSC|nr:uncharacterized protein LY89DRAFT_683151 [Mollisia scopiformis]KUJ19225.1 hypothetical protein LY89DRAFT_683151 [Mollisia scopiformis]